MTYEVDSSESLRLTAFRRTLESQSESYGLRLSDSVATRLGVYFQLIETWNRRLHLVAPCSPAEFAARHILESLTLLPHLTEGAHVVDIGSGGGLPIVPCLIARSDVQATMIEASGKKAVFLREALKATGTAPQASVLAERFETIEAPVADAVTCRAIERFEELLPQIVVWAPRESALLLFGGERLRNQLEQMNLRYASELMPNSDNRFLFVARAVP